MKCSEISSDEGAETATNHCQSFVGFGRTEKTARFFKISN
jgi:hypothetical protein